jgi:uncharacterized protein (TIGR02147 family)
METNSVSIFEYIDYRRYLRDYYEARKNLEPGFSHSLICYKLGQDKSKTYFSNVIAGRKEIGPSFIDRFIELLDLTSDEAKYFRALVGYNQSVRPKEKEFYLDQLVSLNRTPRKFIEKNSYEYFRSWHHSVIRSLLDIVDTDGYSADMLKRLNVQIPAAAAKKSLALLLELGLVKKNKQGKIKPTDKVVSTIDGVKDEIIKRYQMACLELGLNAISVSHPDSHKMSTMTFSCSPAAHKRINERIQQLRSEIRAIIHKDEERASDVYHINLQTFKLTR